MSKRIFLPIFLFLALLLAVLFGPGVCTLYKLETHQPQFETIYRATAEQEPPEKNVYEIPETFRRDYKHLDLNIHSGDSGIMGCSIEYYLANGEKFSFSVRESSSFYRFRIPYEHIKTIQRIEISEIENIADIVLWNTYIEK